jgi:hypothetical protein
MMSSEAKLSLRPAVQEVIDSSFARVEGLVETEPSSRPRIESIDLDVTGSETSSDFHLSLKVKFSNLVTPEAIPQDDEAGLFFNVEGHHVIALIAMADLQSRSLAAATAVQNILIAGNRDLLKAATFPDDIRNSQPETKPFHFVDIPFEEGGPANPPLPHAPHVISQIAEFSSFLNSRRGNDQEKVDALSWLIHLFGDIHQPLHCIERISDEHPAGDRGGNSFKLRGNARNLHSLWDSSVDFGSKSEEELAPAIMDEHSRASLVNDLQVTNVEGWARASFRLARRFAYSIRENPANPPRPTAAYLRKANEIGRRQAAVAGYRLSDRLKEIFDT